MKKLLFVLFVLTAFAALCFSVGAEGYTETDTEYIVYDQDQLIAAVNGVKEGTLANKTIVFGTDIANDTCDFILDGPCDISIDLNGYTYTSKVWPDKSGDFDFRHENAVLRIKNGKMRSNFCVFIFRTQGSLYAEDLDVMSNDECVYQYTGHNGVLNLKNCKMDSTGNYYAVYLNSCNGKGGTLYQIEGGEYAGFGLHCALPGSYMKDCHIYERELFIDSWHAHGENNTDSYAILTNVRVDVQIRLNDYRMDPVLYDCTSPIIQLTANNQIIVSYTSATCENPGSKATYVGSTVTYDEQYALDNPAFGHQSTTEIKYENGYLFSGYAREGCLRCGDYVEEVLAPIFACLGYSFATYGENSLTLSFTVDYTALTRYETVSSREVEFGFAVAVAQYLGDSDMIDENGNAASLSSGNVVLAQLDRESNYVDFKIKGFTEAQSTIPLVMCLYTITTEEEMKTVSYLQAADATGDGRYSTVTLK